MALTAKKLDQVRTTVPVSAATKGETVRVNINVSVATRKAWKLAAIERGINVTEMIEAAVNEYINK